MEDIDAAFHHGLSRESAVPDAKPDDTSEQRTGPPAPTGNRVSLSGLLNALDGIGAQEGRVLFATTNKYSSLDPALCRPGRMDLHIEFNLASRFQAEELFKRFYAPSGSTVQDKDLIDLSEPASEKEGPSFVGVAHRTRAPELPIERVHALAAQFAEAIPERELSMASLQGFLMTHKTRPFGAVEEIGAWVEKELAERRRLESG